MDNHSLILGINEFSHDCSVAVVRENKVLISAEEERFSKKIHHYGFDRGGGAPLLAMDWAAKTMGINSLHEFDRIALSWKGMNFFRWYKCKQKILNLYNKAGIDHYPTRIFKETKTELITKIFIRYLKRQHFINSIKFKDNIVPIEHHLSHASYAYRMSEFEKALIFIFDGSGEDVSISIFIGDSNNIHNIKSYPIDQSIGVLYAIITRMLGFGRDGEGKTMGLAGYGTPLRESLLYYNKERDCFNINTHTIKKLSKHKRKKHESLLQIHKDIAATLQKDVNESLLGVISSYSKRYRVEQICLGGGVANNCTLNGVLQSTYSIFVPAALGDAGTAIGAALEVQAKYHKCYGETNSNPFLGYKADDFEIENALVGSGVRYEICKDVYSDIVHQIQKGQVIGLFIGEAELGPRALGHRSILANPRIKGIKNLINKIKKREKWRPFGLIILEEDSPELFHHFTSSPHMNIAFRPKNNAKKIMPDIVHIDNTVRVQSISENTSNFLYNLLKQVKESIGIGALLNTSFNEKDKPIVNTPQDAIKTFLKLDFDILYIEKYKIKKVL